jgi:plasmid maintenance system killer protein
MIRSFRDAGTEDSFNGADTRRARAGQHSIRVNDQSRVCFAWTDLGPAEVEIVDDH